MPNVTRVYRIPDGHGGGLNVEAGGGQYAETYQVEFDGINENVWAAITATDGSIAVPAYGVRYPADLQSIVLDKHGDMLADDPWTWHVQVRYGYPRIDPQAPAGPGPPGQGGSPPNPIPNQKRTWGTYVRQRAFDRDWSSPRKAIVNSADDPFDPPLAEDEELPEVTFVRPQSTFDPTWKYQFEGAINSEAFKIWSAPDWTAAKYTLKVARITGEEVPRTQNTPAYWTVTIVVQYNPDGWDKKPLDRGWRRKVGANKKVEIFGAGGVKPASPPLLDGAGGELAVGGTPVFLDGVAPATKGPYLLNLQKDFRWLALTV